MSLVSGAEQMSRVDVMTIALDVLEAVTEASGRDKAREAARSIASDLAAEDLRELVTALAMTSVNILRRSQGRRRLKAQLESLRFYAQVAPDDQPEGS